MTNEAQIFTPDLLAKARQSPKHSAPLLHKWARSPEPSDAAFRRQIERAAALVPEDRRARTFGRLIADSRDDDKDRATVGSLLLGKMLIDQGWAVEFDPEALGGRPDFKITKGNTTFVVEVRRVAPHWRSPSEHDLNRVRDALDGITTRTPVSIVAVSIHGGARLEPFREHMRNLLAGKPRAGMDNFHQGNVFVGFDVLPGLDEPMSAYVGCRYSPIYGGQEAEVRKHVNEKLKKYKAPLIVALDFFDSMDPFKDVEEVLLGKETIQISIDMSAGKAQGRPRAGRAADGLLVHRGSDGERARSRLQAVLGFVLLRDMKHGAAIGARMFTNPAAREPLDLAEFAPIPRLVVVDQTKDYLKLQYLDRRGRPLNPNKAIRWRHIL